MENNNRNVVGWFEIPVKDMSRAKKFYEAVFGKKLQDLPMPGQEIAAFPWVQGAPHSAGALVKVQGANPQNDGTMVYFASDDVSKEIQLAEKNGGKMLMPRTSIGEWGFIAHLLDTEGNRIGLHSQK